MKLAGLHLRQRDGVTCGPAAAVVAGALLDPAYRSKLTGWGGVGAVGRAWFDAEQARVHQSVNRIWPRALGTTPAGMARAISAHGVRHGVWYRWHPARGPWCRGGGLADVRRALESGWPVAMLVGRVIPRHWVLIVDVVDDVLQCYEPSSGEVRPVELAAVRHSRMTGVGYPRAFAFVLPQSV